MVQFIPLIIVPQVFVCGLIFPVNQLPNYLQWLANILPLTYGIDGIRALMLQGKGLLDIGKEIGVLVVYASRTFDIGGNQLKTRSFSLILLAMITSQHSSLKADICCASIWVQH